MASHLYLQERIPYAAYIAKCAFVDCFAKYRSVAQILRHSLDYVRRFGRFDCHLAKNTNGLSRRAAILSIAGTFLPGEVLGPPAWGMAHDGTRPVRLRRVVVSHPPPRITGNIDGTDLSFSAIP